MYTGINFLKERARLQELTVIQDRKVAQITSLILGVFLFVTVALLAYQFYLKARLNSVIAAGSEEESKLQSLAPVQTAYVTVSEKLKTVQSIFAKRGNKWDAIVFFYGLLPPGTSIHSVNFQSATGKNELSFTLEAPGVFAYDQLSSVIQSETVKQSGYSLDLGSLIRSPDGSYRVEVALTGAVQAVPTP